ncbi:alpha-tubulin N-acetyltransferase 1 [Aplysia californica]|uniref:Alpha-tubulin N-acetyltransferase n=1 Tax=Aplysia californica TaxID=6500 RepID=A0ABM0JZ49_APLCA|nr:alpha-tubulin N-acetyltransferase 1 [Aplysia californica]
MEFSFNVNQLLKQEITKVDSQLQPCRQNGIDRYGFQQLQRMLYEIVDRMGEASAKAQGLRGSITTGKKLELAGHRLYIMKDSNSNGEKGAVVGILKVGTKKLFVYDHSKVQHELEPLCVLDFYVHESRQRMGCGRKLFDHMLRNEGLSAQHLPIDRPSPKFSSFLKKHYNLRGTIPQVNNFVIFEGFFSRRPADAGSNRGRRRNSVDGRPPMRPNSGHNIYASNNNPAANGYPQSWTNQRNHSGSNVNEDALNQLNVPVSGRPQQTANNMGASEMMYSRHGPSPPNMYNNNSSNNSAGAALQNLRQGPRSASPHNGSVYKNRNGLSPTPNVGMYKNLNGLSSPHMYYNTGMNPNKFYGQPDGLPPKHPSQRPNQFPENPSAPQRGPSSTPNFGNRSMGVDGGGSGGGGGGMNNIAQPASRRTPPVMLDPRYPQSPGTAQHFPDISHQTQTPASGGGVAHRPPSGDRGRLNNQAVANPPILHRDGPPRNYQNMLNMHQTFQDRGGHLKVPQGPPAVAVPGVSMQPSGPPLFGSQSSRDNTWTVSGVLRAQRMNGGLSSQHYNSSRLW